MGLRNFWCTPGTHTGSIFTVRNETLIHWLNYAVIIKLKLFNTPIDARTRAPLLLKLERWSPAVCGRRGCCVPQKNKLFGSRLHNTPLWQWQALWVERLLTLHIHTCGPTVRRIAEKRFQVLWTAWKEGIVRAWFTGQVKLGSRRWTFRYWLLKKKRSATECPSGSHSLDSLVP